MAKIGLYLAGGGARGAYQAGVLKALGDILQLKRQPFALISGVSVGSINAAVLAQYADDFQTGVDKLVSLWVNIHCDQVFNASNMELGKSVFRNLSNLMVPHQRAGFLLDTSPLIAFINKHINFARVRENIGLNRLETMEIISNCYETQQTVSFYQHSQPGFVDWTYPRHISRAVQLGQEHLLSSAALPLFFPVVNIDGLHYGDGSLGLVSPLRGALRFNIDKILIIGTRQLPMLEVPDQSNSYDVGLAQVLGNMMNGLFIDNLDRDIEAVNRMNEIERLLSIWKKRRSPWRPVETLYLRPSHSMAAMAQSHYQYMPTLLRLLLNSLGAKSHSGDLLSFLLFEKEFTSQLIEIGYQDTMASSKAVAALFE